MVEDPGGEKDAAKLQQLKDVIASVSDYPFSELPDKVKKAGTNFYNYLGSPVESDDVVRIDQNVQAFNQIEETLKDDQAVIILAAKRMGTTSIGKHWVSVRDGGQRCITMFSRYTPDQEMEDRKNAEQIFVDEFDPRDNDNNSQVEEFLKSGKKLVFRPQLAAVGGTRELLKSKGAEYREIKIMPLTDTEMKKYLTQQLGVEEGDKMVTAITDLSGGSLLVANNICSVLLENIRSNGDKTRFMNVVGDGYFVLRGLCLESWKDQEESLPDELKQIIPKPLINEYRNMPYTPD
jgi:hypothetical protein